MPFESRHFRRALGAFATGVTIVTTKDVGGLDVGMTANSFSSVSLNPPMVLWSLAKTSSNIDAFRDASGFAVHVLAADQEDLSGRFATKGIDRFAGLELDRGETGTPLLPDCTARFECRTAFQHEGGDHVIFVGDVVTFTHSDRRPLVFHGGRYGRLINPDEGGPDALSDGREETLSPQDLLYHVARAYHHLRHDTVQERRRRGWKEDEYFTIAMLSMEGDISFARLDELVSHRGYAVTSELIASLRQRGIVKPPDPGKPDQIGLTEAGRRAFIETIAVAKAAEADALRDFGPDEVQLLKQLLKRVLPRR